MDFFDVTLIFLLVVAVTVFAADFYFARKAARELAAEKERDRRIREEADRSLARVQSLRLVRSRETVISGGSFSPAAPKRADPPPVDHSSASWTD